MKYCRNVSTLLVYNLPEKKNNQNLTYACEFDRRIEIVAKIQTT